MVKFAAMSLSFAIPREDVERYKRLRAFGREFNQRILETAPRAAMQETGKALGILHKGALVLEQEDVICVLMDCVMHDWIKNGKNLVEKYSETHPQISGSDGDCLLQAYRQARFRLLVLEKAVPGAGIFCVDALSRETLFLMDISLSQSMQGQRGMFASRTAPIGNHWMTTGAGLPVDRTSGEAIKLKLTEERLLEDESFRGQHKMALAIVRACLETGAAERVRYEGPQEEGKPAAASHSQARRSAHVVGRNEPCPCGSGKKYKRCCMVR